MTLQNRDHQDRLRKKRPVGDVRRCQVRYLEGWSRMNHPESIYSLSLLENMQSFCTFSKSSVKLSHWSQCPSSSGNQQPCPALTRGNLQPPPSSCRREPILIWEHNFPWLCRSAQEATFLTPLSLLHERQWHKRNINLYMINHKQ